MLPGPGESPRSQAETISLLCVVNRHQELERLVPPGNAVLMAGLQHPWAGVRNRVEKKDGSSSRASAHLPPSPPSAGIFPVPLPNGTPPHPSALMLFPRPLKVGELNVRPHSWAEPGENWNKGLLCPFGGLSLPSTPIPRPSRPAWLSHRSDPLTWRWGVRIRCGRETPPLGAPGARAPCSTLAQETVFCDLAAQSSLHLLPPCPGEATKSPL